MHDASCYWGTRGRPPMLAADTITARAARDDPFPRLRDNWSSLFAFQFAITNITTESHVLRLIYGPYRIDEFVVAQSANDGRNLHIYLAVDDNPVESTVRDFYSQDMPRLWTGDITTSGRGLGAVVAPMHYHPNQIVNRGTSRLTVVVSNDLAAPQSVWGSITITHLCPAADVVGY